MLTNLNGDSLVERVVWTVEADGDDDPEHTWTDDDPGVSSDFGFAYDDLGSTTGAAVVVEAVAFDAEDNSDTAQTTINVWKKSETVSVVSQTSDHDLVDGSTADVFVQTDVGFWKVEWSVDGSSLPADNGPGLTSQITYDFSSVSHGNTVTFTATPYGVNADGEEVAGESATIAVSVWKPIEATLDVPKKCVEDESIDITLETTVPFDWVQYTIEGTNEVDPSNETSDTWSEIDHTFAIGGDRDGSPRTVTAVATYVTPSGTVVKSSPETATVKLYDNHGFQWRRMVSRVESFYNVLDDLYIFTSGHTIEYYYDGRPVDDRLRRKAGWYENGEAHGKLKWPPDAAFFATPAFWDSFTLPMDTPATLARGEEYHVFAYTNYGAGNAPAEVFSEKARYDPDAADPLPIPTGTEDESENPNLPDALKGESENPKLPDILPDILR